MTFATDATRACGRPGWMAVWIGESPIPASRLPSSVTDGPAADHDSLRAPISSPAAHAAIDGLLAGTIPSAAPIGATITDMESQVKDKLGGLFK
jgi:hypothetical protein